MSGFYIIVTSAVTGCVSISGFDYLAVNPISIASSAVEIKICAITAGINSYKSSIKKKNNVVG